MHPRRHFIRATLAGPLLASFAPAVPLFLSRALARAAATPTADGRVLVVIQLTGGNDGLNTVVPFEDDAYARSRPTLRLKASEVRKIRPFLGLHPRMGAFERLFKDGRLAILQGVGCAGLSRDHEAAMRAWHTAEPAGRGLETGWLGRATDQLWQKARPAAPGVFVGSIPRPLGIHAASAVVPTLAQISEVTPTTARLSPEIESIAVEAPENSPGAVWLGHVRASLALARAHARRLEEVARTLPPKPYPACGLGNDLRTVARLIRAETGIRVFHTELGGGGIGGFDNHANQLGNHCALLEQLAEAVAAFVADLETDRLLDRVLLMTFSEFGRTVAENGRRGTDHGAAGPMFLAGGKVRGGVHGAHPSLTELEGDALKPSVDFRAVYALALEEWLGLPSAPILGAEFDRPALLAST